MPLFVVERQHPVCMVLALNRKSTRLNSSHSQISYAVFCLKKTKNLYCPPPDQALFAHHHDSIPFVAARVRSLPRSARPRSPVSLGTTASSLFSVPASPTERIFHPRGRVPAGR